MNGRRGDVAYDVWEGGGEAVIQTDLQFSAQRSVRPLMLGVHHAAVIEIDVTAEENRNLEAAWRLCSFGHRGISDQEWVKRLRDAQERIFGFDWEGKFKEFFPDRMPSMTTRVTL